jgi:hypothetical protein
VRGSIVLGVLQRGDMLADLPRRRDDVDSHGR